MPSPLTIDQVNDMSEEEFITIFRGVVEHGFIVTVALCSYRPFLDAQHLCSTLESLLDILPTTFQASLLRCHPALASHSSRPEQLTRESAIEQAGAKLDALNTIEQERIENGNIAYRKQFGFPFVICVRDNNFSSILQNLSSRLHHSLEEEILTGIQEVKKICKHRVGSILAISE